MLFDLRLVRFRSDLCLDIQFSSTLFWYSWHHSIMVVLRAVNKKCQLFGISHVFFYWRLIVNVDSGHLQYIFGLTPSAGIPLIETLDTLIPFYLFTSNLCCGHSDRKVSRLFALYVVGPGLDAMYPILPP